MVIPMDRDMTRTNEIEATRRITTTGPHIIIIGLSQPKWRSRSGHEGCGRVGLPDEGSFAGGLLPGHPFRAL